ncbi:hypothetical protein FACS18945_5470 [Bacteroidia bacterium]|nr:hypothetical protein FACS18945_5470 [Bacteroidia bacterium]
MNKSGIIRCSWGDVTDELMREHHDKQWGKPCRNERALFDILIEDYLGVT